MEVTRRRFVAGTLVFPIVSSELHATEMIVRPAAHTVQGKIMLQRYRHAVERMKSLPRYHPHSWYFQSAIHDKPSPADDEGEPTDDEVFALNQPESSKWVTRGRELAFGDGKRLQTWRTCPHSTKDKASSLFLPWHRMFLWNFERIVARYAGDSFALPYWDYTLTDEDKEELDTSNDRMRRVLPLEFREPVRGNVTNNALYFAERKPLVNDLLTPAALDRAVVRIGNAMRCAALIDDVNAFSTALENTPHGDVHWMVGSAMGMGSIAYAARDPIFWLHHATIDWLWESWRRAPTPGADPIQENWLKQRFAFVDEAARYQEFTVGNAVRNTDMLGYRYDVLKSLSARRALIPRRGPRPFDEAPAVAEYVGSGAAATVGSSPVAVTLKVVGSAQRPFSDGGLRAFLVLKGVSARKRPSGVCSVYVDRALNAPAATPDNLAGTLNFFGRFDHSDGGGFDRSFDVTEILMRWPAASGEIVVTLVPLMGDDDHPIRVSTVKVIVL